MGIKYLDVYISQLSILIPLSLGLLRWKFLNKSYQWIFWGILAGTLAEILTKVGAYFGNNFYAAHLDTIAQGFTLIAFFYFSLKHDKAKRYLLISLILLLLIELFEIIMITGLYNYNSITRSYLSVLMSVLSISYLYRLRQNEILVDVHRHPMFWFCLAILMYYLANFLIFFFGFQLNQQSVLDFLFAHRVHLVILILSRIMLAIGFWHVPKTRHLWS